MNLNYTLINSKSLEELIPDLTEDLQTLTKTVEDNEEVTAAALSNLNERVDNITGLTKVATTAPANPTTGSIYFDATNGLLVYNGTNWVDSTGTTVQ